MRKADPSNQTKPPTYLFRYSIVKKRAPGKKTKHKRQNQTRRTKSLMLHDQKYPEFLARTNQPPKQPTSPKPLQNVAAPSVKRCLDSDEPTRKKILRGSLVFLRFYRSANFIR
jgi:hypothetical protein